MSAVILQFPTPKDSGKGYKARFRAVRERLGLAAPTAPRCDLTQGHADPEADTRPSELA